MYGTTGGPAYKPKPATVAHDPRKAPLAIKGVNVKTTKTKGKGK
jgi:hypothetical protein